MVAALVVGLLPLAAWSSGRECFAVSAYSHQLFALDCPNGCVRDDVAAGDTCR